MKYKITFILSLLVLLNSTVGYSYQGEVFTLSSLTATEKKSAKSIWNIIFPTGNGTGFFISKNELVTNFHVVDDLTQYNIKKFYLIQEGHSRTLKIKQIKHLSTQHDLAVLEIKDEVSDYLKISEEIPQPDEYLFSIGYPDGQFSIIKKTSDIFSFDESSYSFFSDHSYLDGASGSPLLNLKGEVVGVLSTGSKNTAGGIKAIRLKNLLSEEIKSFENPEDHVAHTIEQLKKAANQGNKGAQFRLGFYYDQGEGVIKQDYKEAVYWYEQAAQQGYAKAQDNLGYMYAKGKGVAQDYKAAVRWYSKAAEQGYVKAQYSLGVMYHEGKGVAQDYKTAVQWFSKAAEQGDASAQYNLGFMYNNGEGVVQDYKAAVQWYRKAAEQGYADAQYNLGLMYKNGKGVVQDFKAAMQWYSKVAEQGDADAQYNLGYMYSNGQGVTQDYKAAVQWYRKAAEQGIAKAQYNLGVMYDKGLGVAQDYKAVVQWYSKAAEQGDAGAQFNLGRMYYNGEGVTQDYKAAVQWFSKAAQQGYASAQNNLGVMYYMGRGVAQDTIRAHMWFNLAASIDADTKSRDTIAKKMTFAAIEKAQSLARDCLAKNYQDC